MYLCHGIYYLPLKNKHSHYLRVATYYYAPVTAAIIKNQLVEMVIATLYYRVNCLTTLHYAVSLCVCNTKLLYSDMVFCDFYDKNTSGTKSMKPTKSISYTLKCLKSS